MDNITATLRRSQRDDFYRTMSAALGDAGPGAQVPVASLVSGPRFDQPRRHRHLRFAKEWAAVVDKVVSDLILKYVEDHAGQTAKYAAAQAAFHAHLGGLGPLALIRRARPAKQAARDAKALARRRRSAAQDSIAGLKAQLAKAEARLAKLQAPPKKRKKR